METGQRYPPFNTLIQHHSESPSQCNKVRKIKSFRLGEGEILLFADDRTAYIKSLKEYTKKVPKINK